MNTTYKPKVASLSPYQNARAKSLDFQQPNHPVLNCIAKLEDEFNLSIAVRQDYDTLALLKDLEGVVAFKSILKRNGTIISEGRSSIILGRSQKYFESSVLYCRNASITDAVLKGVKMLEAFTKEKDDSIELKEIYEDRAVELITPKQKSYLSELITTQVIDEAERERWQSSISEMTKDEASQAIQDFKN